MTSLTVSMEYYGPRYKLEVLANNADDHNPPEYLEKIKYVVLASRVHLADTSGAR